ncbi:MAG TPA: ribosome silencing factor [Bacteroidales bacterium]|mgnify:CR=1 FL=1|nr:ribosome silencing factor [Bacteroidales bacterium]
MAKRICKDKKTAQELLNIIIEAADEKKAQNIVALDLTPFETRVCDYFVICHADTTIQIESIVENIQVKTKKELNDAPFSVEGKQNSYWVILDYVNIVVHVMQTQAREYYELEKLWADAAIVKPKNVV